jgi:hypothetical protein
VIVGAYQVATTGHCQQGQREQIRYDKIKYCVSQLCELSLKNVRRGFLQFLNLLFKINHAVQVVQLSPKADVPRSSSWMHSCHAWCRTVLQYMCLNMGVQLIFKYGASVPGHGGQLLKGPNPIKQMGCFEANPKRSSKSGLAFESQLHASTSPPTINSTSYLMISFSLPDQVRKIKYVLLPQHSVKH